MRFRGGMQRGSRRPSIQGGAEKGTCESATAIQVVPSMPLGEDPAVPEEDFEHKGGEAAPSIPPASSSGWDHSVAKSGRASMPQSEGSESSEDGDFERGPVSKMRRLPDSGSEDESGASALTLARHHAFLNFPSGWPELRT